MRSVALKFGWLAVVLLVLSAPLRLCATSFAGELLAVRETLEGGGSQSNVAYAYDQLGRVVLEAQGVAINGTVSANGTNLSSGVSGGFVNQYAYDHAGNRISAVYGVGRSDLRTLTSTYDSLNRLKTVTDDAGRATTYHYDAAGNKVQLMQGNGGYVATQYDALGRQTEITGYAPNPNPIAGGTTTEYYDYQLAYDQFGNLRQQVETYPGGQLAGRTVDLNYDSDDRLINDVMISGNATVSSNYTYDNGQNRTGKLVTQTIGANTTTLANITYVVSSRNTLTSVITHLPGNATTTASYMYDPNGNAIQRTYSDSRWVSGSSPNYYINYAYDFENRLVSSQGSDSAGNVSAFSNDNEYFTYDYRTRRVQQEEVHSYRGPGSSSWATSDVKTASVFSGGTAIREYSESQSPSAGTWLASNTALTPSAEFIRGSDWGGGVGGILYAIHQSGTGSGDAGVNYYHYDGRGDVVAQTTGFNGTLSYQAAYTAFGEHSPAAPSDPNMSGPPNSVVVQGFGAEEWTAAGAQTDHFRKNTKEESDSGLVNEGQRYFNPELGRFMTPDPLGFADGTNPYTYVHQNPWTKFDPEGLATIADYQRDAAYNQTLIDQDRYKNMNTLRSGGYGDRTSAAAWDKFNVACADTEQKLGFWIKNDEKAIRDIVSTAQDANMAAHEIVVRAQDLDDGKYSPGMRPDADRAAKQQAFAGITPGIMEHANTLMNTVGMVDGAGELWNAGKAIGLGVKNLLKMSMEMFEVNGGKEAAENLGADAEGIVYRRTNPKTGETYIGQAKSPARFEARQGEHDATLGVAHDYEIVGRADPGPNLDVLEESKIRENGGLQKEGGDLANQRHQMVDDRYRANGGTVDDPNH